MTLTLPLEKITRAEAELAGGKAVALASLHRRGYQVPFSRVISTVAYRRYLETTGLDTLILMELGRKDFQQMRWEEIWDAALRIRSLFLTTPLPPELETELAEALAISFGTRQPLVLRSSAPGEDSGSSSFAGLHSSYVNIVGREQHLLAVRKVWASLWSDRALLYRQELGLEITTSSMAVLVQELVSGETSGVAFSRNPNNSDNVVIEAVRGLNQGLVDGSIEPDFWTVARRTAEILDFRPARRESKMIPVDGSLQLASLPKDEQEQPPLTDTEVIHIARTALALEDDLGQPQDIEWTLAGGQLILLQARPVTTGDSNSDDPRSWYLSLHRSLENLKQLKVRIETEILPGMEAEAALLATINLQALSAQQLAEEIERRRDVQRHWEEAYRSDCIPMAHGIRLFGEFYNDALRPQDPFEFIELLRGTDFRAVVRNRKLTTLAEQIRSELPLPAGSEMAQRELPPPLAGQLDSLAESLDLPVELTWKLLCEMARQPGADAVEKNRDLEANYRQQFTAAERQQAEEILSIGRASYRLRDDDNISLDKINRELNRAEQEARLRLQEGEAGGLRALLARDSDRHSRLSSPRLSSEDTTSGDFRARQLQGQPASPGLATARARVIHKKQDLADFHRGEILVCDAIDPAMTFVVPLAAGILERRGGMLIHGAIIAREYGIPCVSGITAAADIISTGDLITLDGYLGLVFFPPTSGKLSLAGQTASLRKELDDAAEG